MPHCDWLSCFRVMRPVMWLADSLSFFFFSAGIFGSSLLDSSPLPSPEPIADSDPGYHGNSTNPSPSVQTENITATQRNHSGDDVTHGRDHSTPAATTSVRPASTSSQAPPTQPYTKPPDWLASVTSLSTTWPTSTTAAPDSGITYTGQEAAGLHGKCVTRKRTIKSSYLSLWKNTEDLKLYPE